jgi:hypothetical protein
MEKVKLSKEIALLFATEIYKDIKPFIYAHHEAYAEFLENEHEEEMQLKRKRKSRKEV